MLSHKNRHIFLLFFHIDVILRVFREILLYFDQNLPNSVEKNPPGLLFPEGPEEAVQQENSPVAALTARREQPTTSI